LIFDLAVKAELTNYILHMLFETIGKYFDQRIDVKRDLHRIKSPKLTHFGFQSLSFNVLGNFLESFLLHLHFSKVTGENFEEIGETKRWNQLKLKWNIILLLVLLADFLDFKFFPVLWSNDVSEL
jgi:hypothetical protein